MRYDTEDGMLHPLPADAVIPDKFTYPFCYTPAEVTVMAAGAVMKHIAGTPGLAGCFSGGKMLGVLTVLTEDGKKGFLAAFSGLAGGSNRIPYFVPPVIDLLEPDGHFKITESEISAVRQTIEEKEHSPQMAEAVKEVEAAEKRKADRTAEWKAHMARSKARRDMLRAEGKDTASSADLIRESQFEKAQLRRITRECDMEVARARERLNEMISEITDLKRARQRKSEELQRWISENSIVCNARGENMSIWEIFSRQGLVPPGGTGECAAPKLLDYAYRHGLKPVAMGEFWYDPEYAGVQGDTTSTCRGRQEEARIHGRFYPSCKGKCGPLLPFMLEGLEVEGNPLELQKDPSGDKISILYDDRYMTVAVKPSGMLSVPGKTGTRSFQEILSEKTGTPLLSVHRLDMDTSGIMVFAKDSRSKAELQRQFAAHEVRKTYSAVLDTSSRATALGKGDKGTISLPLSPDYLDRPRQKADFLSGKEAVTHYEVTDAGDGWAEIEFMPVTGRTHQLRVHASHPEGLGCPISGDRLYGNRNTGTSRLHLHACRIQLRHPVTGCLMEFFSESPFISRQEHTDTD